MLLPIMQRLLRSGTSGVAPLSPVTHGQHTGTCSSCTTQHGQPLLDPVTGIHTQNVESYWNRVKMKFERMKGVHQEMLTFYMDEFMWHERHNTGASTVLATLCRDIAIFFPFKQLSSKLPIIQEHTPSSVTSQMR